MTISPLTEKSISYVIDHLSDEGKQELAAFGTTAVDLEAKFTGMIGHPFTGCFYDDEGICCALLGLECIGMKKWRSHFAATEGAFKRIGSSLTRFLTQFSDMIVKKEGGEIEICSPFGSGKAFDWFTTMGFNLVAQDGNIHKYVKKRE